MITVVPLANACGMRILFPIRSTDDPNVLAGVAAWLRDQGWRPCR